MRQLGAALAAHSAAPPGTQVRPGGESGGLRCRRGGLRADGDAIDSGETADSRQCHFSRLRWIFNFPCVQGNLAINPVT